MGAGADGPAGLPLAWRDASRSGARFRDIDDRVWDPASGAEGLNERNFPAAFRAAGLNIATAQALLRMGYNVQQITNAGQDARALGLDTRDQRTVLNFAELDRLDPEGRERRRQIFERFQRWSQEQGEELRRLQAAVDSARTDAERTEAQRRMQQFVRQGEDQTGVSQERARFPQTQRDPQHPNRPTGAEAVGDISRSLVQQQTGLRLELGMSRARTADDRDASRTLDRGVGATRTDNVHRQDVRVAEARTEDTNTDAMARLRRRRGLSPTDPTSNPEGAPPPSATEPSDPPSPARPAPPQQAVRPPSITPS